MKSRSFRFFYCIALITFVLFSQLTKSLSVLPDGVHTVSAGVQPIFYPGYGIATIDGYIHSDEWTNADTISFTTALNAYYGTLYVMQTEQFLFLGLSLEDDEFTTGSWFGVIGDSAAFRFDDNNSGVLFEAGENLFILGATDPWIKDMFFYDDTGSARYDTWAGGTTDGIGLSGRHAIRNHYEIRIPLCSGDAYDFCIQPGTLIGFQLEYTDIYPSGDGFTAQIGKYPGLENNDLAVIQLLYQPYKSYFPLAFR